MKKNSMAGQQSAATVGIEPGLYYSDIEKTQQKAPGCAGGFRNGFYDIANVNSRARI
jgi:hypothetical protein